MGILGQGLQRTPRIATGRLDFVGIDFVSAAGSFNWTVPAGVDALDIVAVGGGVGPFGGAANANGASGSVAQRVGKYVLAGQVISGTVGAAGSAYSGGGNSTVDGMTAQGAPAGAAGAPIPTTSAVASGGDINFPGYIARAADVYSLTGAMSGPSVDGSPRWSNGSQPGTSESGGLFPGGGAFTSSSSVGYGGGSGAVFFIMYRRAS